MKHRIKLLPPLSLAALLLIISLGGWAVVQLLPGIAEKVEGRGSRGMYFVTKQLETEYLQAQRAIDVYLADGPIDYDEAMMRFDIFWSRVHLIQSDHYSIYFGIPTWAPLIEKIEAVLPVVDAGLKVPDVRNDPEARAAVETFGALWGPISSFTQEALHDVWAREEQQDARIYRNALLVMGLAIFLALLLAAGLSLYNLRQQRLIRSETEARRLAEEAAHARDRFLASVSHELRTPLNAIIGFSSLMKDEVFGSLEDRYREYSDDIHESGQHLLRIVNHILDLSKALDGNQAAEIEDCDLDEIVGKSIRISQSLAEQGQVALDVRLLGRPIVRTDSVKMEQILLNLLSNAIKFTPSGGRVDLLGIYDRDGPFIIEIHDTGPGIDPEAMKRVFEPFYQAKDVYVRVRGTGTGLGLALTRQMAHALSVRVDLQSEAGKGTVARVVIPEELIVGFREDYAGARAVAQ